MGGRSGTVRPRRTAGYEDIRAPTNTTVRYRHRLLVGVPTLGQVRIEWHNAMSALIMPTNFSNSKSTPIGFTTADAQNLLVHQALTMAFEWLLFIEDDVLPPPDLLVKLRPYMQDEKVPVVAGLYHLKGNRPEPLIYRGRGNGPWTGFKAGENTWVDGVHTGCTLIHSRLLQAVWDASESYTLSAGGTTTTTRRVFESPRHLIVTETGHKKLLGTSDLYFCDRVMKEGHLAKAGWPRLQRKKYPFLVDTSIACGHIDRSTGHVY